MNMQATCLRLAERITWHACTRLPEPERAECYQEWTAELPEFLCDDNGRAPALRMMSMMWCAVDYHRGARQLAAAMRRDGRFRTPRPVTLALLGIGNVTLRALMVCAALGLLAADICWQAGYSDQTGILQECNEAGCSRPVNVPPDLAAAHQSFLLAGQIANLALPALLIVAASWLVLWSYRHHALRASSRGRER